MQAPLYFKIITIYFAILPFLLAYSVYQAILKKYALHIKSQILIFVISIIVILYFEIMLRLTGGFLYYKQYSDFSENFMITYLLIHILIAIFAVILWGYVLFSSIKSYKRKIFDSKNHKKLGKIVFILISISSLMGIGMYFILFDLR